MNLAGLKVKCPNCKRVGFETTEKYDPNIRANGAMVKKISSVIPWQIDWLMTSGTLAAEMVCPLCGQGVLAPSGFLNVIVSIRDAGEIYRMLFPQEATEDNLSINKEQMSSLNEMGVEVVNNIPNCTVVAIPEAIDNATREFPSEIKINGTAEVIVDDTVPDNKVQFVTTDHFVDNGDNLQKVLDEAAFACPTCGKSFDTQRKLSGHMMSHKRGK